AFLVTFFAIEKSHSHQPAQLAAKRLLILTLVPPDKAGGLPKGRHAPGTGDILEDYASNRLSANDQNISRL
ncbi:MAG: hypothetical protein WD397_15180, partial [Wenzhouxiangellaceae bacterium]